jgi:hypothetical protein
LGVWEEELQAEAATSFMEILNEKVTLTLNIAT